MSVVEDDVVRETIRVDVVSEVAEDDRDAKDEDEDEDEDDDIVDVNFGKHKQSSSEGEVVS